MQVCFTEYVGHSTQGYSKLLWLSNLTIMVFTGAEVLYIHILLRKIPLQIKTEKCARTEYI